MSLLFNTLSMFVIAFLPGSECLLISRLQSPSAVLLEPKKRKPVTLSLHDALPISGDSDGKDSACNAGNLGSIPGLERSPGEGNGNPLQYFGLENSMDCVVHGVAKSQTRLSNFHFHFSISL